MRIITSILLLCVCVPSYAQSNAKEKITLEQIWASGMFRSESVYGLKSMNDGVHYTLLDNDRGSTQKINQYAYATGELLKTIVDLSNIALEETKGAPFKVDGYSFSSNEKKLLFSTQTEKIYRHSTRSKYYVYDIATKKIELLSADKQRYATFSSSGNQVAFVRANNLFVKNLETGKELQLTSDGKKNEIINGATDWVYEEEFAFDKAFFWSPTGNSIAYYKFNESAVKEFNMPIYGTLYPQDNPFKYPKAGEKNSIVQIEVANIISGNISTYSPEANVEYIPRVKWSKTDDALIIYTMNRHQSNLKLINYNPTEKSSSVLYEENNDAYIDITDNFYVVGANKGFIFTSEKSGFNHLHYQSWNGSKNFQITKGEWEVTDVYGFEENSGTIYFQGAKNSPMNREVYKTSIKGSGPQKLTPLAGWNNATFSSGFKYFINYHSTVSSPSYISLHKNSGKEIRVLKDNTVLNLTLTKCDISKPEFLTIPVNGETLNAYMIKPSNFDPSKKYPVLMYVYGGPGSQTVKNSWGGANYLWYQMMAQKGYIIVSVDNRGTGARGEKFKKLTYKQLGKYETEDQISSAKWLAGQSYVDASRIGIWGWSYGGYMSSLCLFKGNDIFKTAMAVAPVTNWKYYDSIYTERYMQTPEENSGYDENSPITHVDSLKGNYLLVHGTGDDNVHFQNSIEMVTALQKANKQFDFMMYPNKNHGIYGGNTRLQLFQMLTNYVEENL
ncbi:MAG: S9 family peptidase [Salibacteraceae bacterium]|nr:S9 family peptidase [Salibacteraceae bacterium]